MAVAEFDKAMTVAKLKDARDRARRMSENDTREGRKSYEERNPQMVALAKHLRGGMAGGRIRCGRLRPNSQAMAM